MMRKQFLGTWRVNTVSFSPDGSSILSASRDNSDRLWNAKTLELEDRIQLSDSLLDPKAVFSSDGKWIAAASEAYQKPFPNIVFWEKTGSAYPNPITIPTDHISSLAFSPSPNGGGSEYLLTSYEDGQLDLWQKVCWKLEYNIDHRLPVSGTIIFDCSVYINGEEALS